MWEFYKLMRNNIFTILIFYFFTFSLADELDIKAKKINIDKKTKITIFENEVVVKDQFNNSFNADYVLYNRENNTLELKGNILSKDSSGNVFKASKATYDNNKKIFKSFGESSFETLEGYKIITSDIIIDNKNTFMGSDKETLSQILTVTKFTLKTLNILKKIIFLNQLDLLKL